MTLGHSYPDAAEIARSLRLTATIISCLAKGWTPSRITAKHRDASIRKIYEVAREYGLEVNISGGDRQ